MSDGEPKEPGLVEQLHIQLRDRVMEMQTYRESLDSKRKETFNSETKAEIERKINRLDARISRVADLIGSGEIQNIQTFLSEDYKQI